MAKKGLSQTQAYLIIAAVSLIFIVAIAGFFTLPMTKTTGTNKKDPGSTTSTVVSSNSGYTATVWQSLFITNKDNTKYWANAPKPFTLASIFGSASGNGDDFNEIASEQDNIYMNLPQTCDSWTFSCQETIMLTDTSGTTIGYFQNMDKSSTPVTVNANGNFLASQVGQNVWVAGSTINETTLQSVLAQPVGNYYFVVTLANINLTLTVNGQQSVLTYATATSDNVLAWLIQIK